MRHHSLKVALLALAASIVALGCNPSTREAADSFAIGKPRILDLSTDSMVTNADVDFGAVLVGVQTDVILSVGNEGDASTSIEGVSTSEGLAGAFTYDHNAVVLGPGQRLSYHVGFRPTSAGEFSGRITLEVLNGDVASLSIQLHGIAVQPSCEVSAQTLDFGTTPAGTAYPLQLRIRNASSVAYSVMLANVMTAQGDDDAFEYAAGFGPGDHLVPASGDEGTPGELIIPIEFKPIHQREYSGVLNIQAPSFCPSSIALHGTGVLNALECEPVVEVAGTPVWQLDFGFVVPGDKATRTVSCRNLGHDDMHMTLVSVTQPAGSAPFAIEGSDRVFTIPTGGTPVTLAFSFAPTELGDQRGRVNLSSDDPNNPSNFIEVVGVGGGPRINVQPAQLDFGKVAVDSYLVRRITVANVGVSLAGRADDTLVLAIKSGSDWTEKQPEIVGPDAAEFSLEWPPLGYLSAGLEEGQNADLKVHFSPHSAGSKTATLIVYSNDGARPRIEVSLAGLAVSLPPCDYEIKPPTLNFGSVESGKKLTLHLTIVNRDPDPTHQCLVSMLDRAPSTAVADAFALANGPVDSATIDGGQSLTVPVRFQPRTDGTYAGEVDFYISTPNPLVAVALAGVAQPQSLTIAPREFEFGATGINCNSRQRTFTIFNTTGTSQTVTAIDLQPGSSSEFTVTHRPPLPAVVYGWIDFAVTYHPIDAGTDTGVVVLTVSGNVNPYFVPLTGVGTTDPVQTEVFTPRPKVDVLLVMDDSDSEDVQIAFGSNFSSFIAPAQQRGVDYHIAVTTVSIDSGGGIGNCSPGEACGRFVPITGTNPRVITPSTPNQAQVFSQNVHVGTNGSGTEALIRPAYLALQTSLLSGHNAGFYRDEAQLAVAVISSAVDQDPLATPLSFYESFLNNLKGPARRNDVSFSGIIPTLPLPPLGCGYDSYDASMDTRVKTVARDTGGLVQEICNPYWSAASANLGARVFGLRTTWFLATTPDLTAATPLTITIDGQPVAQYGSRGERHWDYDATLNAIVFDPLSTPDPSSTLSISYHVACL